MQRTSWIAAAALPLALASCEQPDPMTQARTQCADVERLAAERIAACTTLIEFGEGAERAGALANRGAAKNGDGDVTGGLRDFEAALSADPDNALALLGRGGILVASGQLDAAQPLLERAAARDRTGEAEQLLGRIGLQQSDFAGAIAHFDAALERNRGYALAMAGRARAKQRQGDLEGARGDYDAAVRLEGTLAEARAGRCWLDLTQERELGRARTDAEAAVAAQPDLVEAQICRGVLQLRGGEWALARASFDAALAVEPGNPTALFGRGVARRRSGDTAGTADMNLARDFDRRIGASFDEMGVDTY